MIYALTGTHDVNEPHLNEGTKSTHRSKRLDATDQKVRALKDMICCEGVLRPKNAPVLYSKLL